MSLCINPSCAQPNHSGNDASRFCQSCGAGLVLQERYRVMRLLSDKSGFGRVYEAYERNTPKLLKVLKEQHKDSPKAIELFEQEALVLSRLRHPGIPRVEEDGCFQFKPCVDSDPLHCIIMEKIDGPNLSEWMRQQGRNPISEKQALNWLRQLADILNLVHHENFFHRDIKPENIMLRSSGQLVLVDFGAAREMTYTYFEQLSATGGITKVSSTGYTPPEQERGQAVPQSDFYALGCTFIFLLTGKTPTDPAIYDSLNNEFRWRQFAPHISAELASLIDCMSAARASDRPQSTDVLIDKVVAIAQAFHARSKEITPIPAQSYIPSRSDHLQDYSSQGHPGQQYTNEAGGGANFSGANHDVNPFLSSPIYPSSPLSSGSGTATQAPDTTVQKEPPKKQRLWIAGVVIALIAAGGVGTWGLSRMSQTANNVVPVEPEPYVLSDTLSRHTKHITVLDLSFDQQTLASGSDDTTVILWGMVDRQVKFVLQGHKNPVNALAFSPSNRYVASAGDDVFIKIWDVETGAEVQTLTGHTTSVNDVLFTSDSERLISASADETIKIWNWRSGEEVMTLSGHQGFVNAIALSPDGRTLISGATDNTIRVWDVATGEERRQLLGHTSFVNAIAISPDGQWVGSASADATIKLWNLNTGTEIRMLDAHDSYVNALLFSPDGRFLLSSSADQTIKLWERATGNVEASIPWAGTFIDTVAVKFEGPTWQVIAGGKGSQDIQIWQLKR